ncbi:hypothetical protein BDZ89DRAFT_1140431 [Hymenopellis radicata]|nr:hypothetical protein BDZ89DRAFT_1140431 [Hymenopellis radicata]
MTDYHADTTAVLPGFSPAARDDLYAVLHDCLWRTAASPSQPDSAGPEPKRLAEFIEACDGDGEATAMDVDDSEQPPPAPAPPIRYIDLKKKECLAVGKTRFMNKLIVRQEYVEFMTDASAIASKGGRANFFLTGKSVGGVYFLLRLLASRQSVFMLPTHDMVVYFSDAGVEICDTIRSVYANTGRVLNAIKNSWVIIDVDGGVGWTPGIVFAGAKCLVWTASPMRRGRLNDFMKRFSATVWYMKPWSSEEIAAVTILEKKDRKDVEERLKMCGPVARKLFDDTVKIRHQAVAIDQAVVQAVGGNVFDIATSSVVDETQASHRMFLVRPQEVIDTDGQCFLDRGLCSIEFISNYVASRTAEKVEEHMERLRGQLARAFDGPNTRSAAGKLVESMLHRALIHGKVDVPATFGGGEVQGELELIGQAKDFFLERHEEEQRTCRPLYLRPQASNFAAVDAILVTENVLCLIQASLSASHSHAVKTLLQVLTRLKTNKIQFDCHRLVYCVVGTDEDRVEKLVCEASKKVKALQADPRSKELGTTSAVARERLMRIEVEGFTVDIQKGLVPLSK